MKKLSVVIALIMIFTLALTSLYSCKPEKISSYDIIFLRPDYTINAKTDPLTEMLTVYMDTYQCKVTTVSCNWMDWTTKVITQAAAGRPVDVVFTGTPWIGGQMNGGYIQPINGYVNMKAPKFMKDVAKGTYTYAGKTWAAPIGVHVWCIFFNKNLFDDAGLDNPYELNEKGKWDYDAFEAAAKAITKDTNNDGEIDVFGIATWWLDGFAWGNAGYYVSFNKSGKLESGMNSNSLLTGLSFYQRMMQYNNAAAEATFKAGNAGMWVERRFAEPTLYALEKAGRLNFEYGYAPFPYGPDNKDKYNIVDSDGYAIGADSKNPAAAGKCIDILVDTASEAYAKGSTAEYSEGAKEYFAELAAHSLAPAVAESVLDVDGSAALDAVLSEINAGNNVASTLASHANEIKAAVERANAVVERPIFEDFEPYSNDFEAGDLSKFKAHEGTTLEIVDAIEGKALKITPQVTDANTEILKIDYPLPAWNSYKVTFKMQNVSGAAQATKYYVKLFAQDGTEVDSKIVYMNVADVNDFEAVFAPVLKNQNGAYIAIYCEKNAEPVYLDNFSIDIDAD